MKYEIEITSKFKRDYKQLKKRNYDMTLLKEAIDIIAKGECLPERFSDHALNGNYVGYRECHIEPDWLLIYRTEKKTLVLVLTRTGTHSDLF